MQGGRIQGCYPFTPNLLAIREPPNAFALWFLLGVRVWGGDLCFKAAVARVAYSCKDA